MVSGIGDIRAKTLLSYCGSAKEIFKKSKSQLAKIPGIGLINADKIKSYTNFSSAEAEIKNCQTHGVDILFFTDKRYPNKLKHAPDSPTVLYYRGKADLNNNKTVAVVGTRKSTANGRQFAEKLVERLASHQALKWSCIWHRCYFS